ncbi:MFS transporter, partial [Streptomyces californicus]
LAGASSAGTVTFASSLLKEVYNPKAVILGRVTSVSTLFTYAVIPLSYPVTGTAVALWGTGPVYTVSAAVCAAGGVLGLALTVLRRAELPR